MNPDSRLAKAIGISAPDLPVPFHGELTVGRVVNLKELILIVGLHRQAQTISAIAERTRHDHKTARKYFGEGLKASICQPGPPPPT